MVKILAGYHDPDPGATAEIAGQPFELGSATAAREAGLRFVHQNLSLIESMTVADNFRLEGGGRRLVKLDRRAERAAATRALEAIGFDIDPTRMVADLAESERTAVAVARALDHSDPVPLLVLDEPTASLPGPEVERLFAAVRRVAAEGTSILFISHHLDEVLGPVRPGDDPARRSRGGDRRVGELSHDSLVELMLGRQLVTATAGARPLRRARGRRTPLPRSGRRGRDGRRTSTCQCGRARCWASPGSPVRAARRSPGC